MNPKLTDFNDFIKILLASGFSIGGGNDEGIYAVVDYDWLTVPLDSTIVWHTGDLETDPWEWRVRFACYVAIKQRMCKQRMCC